MRLGKLKKGKKYIQLENVFVDEVLDLEGLENEAKIIDNFKKVTKSENYIYSPYY